MARRSFDTTMALLVLGFALVLGGCELDDLTCGPEGTCNQDCPCDPDCGCGLDPSQCVGAIVSNGRIFYTGHGGGLQVSQVYGDEAAPRAAPWEMESSAPADP